MTTSNARKPSTVVSTEFDNLVDLLRWRASIQPDQILYRFLADGETEQSNISYGQLDRAARSIAALLQLSNPCGARALLLFPPGIDFIAAFLGCLYAGVIAVPVYPPNPSRPDRGLGKFTAIALNSGAQWALTISPLLAMKDQLLSGIPELQSIEWLATDAVSEDRAENWTDPKVHGDTVALLQYTSGSTGSPRGVIVSQANLIANQRTIQQSFQSSDQCSGVSWLPMYHDMGLIGTTLQPLYAGYPFVLMSPVDFLQRPVRWLNAISAFRATTSGGPNFAYDLCVRKVTAEQMTSLDLSCWDLAFNGAEPVRSETMEAFAEKFEPCGFKREAFYPCYGLAEGTLFVTGGTKLRAPKTLRLQASALLNHRVIEAVSEGLDARTLVSCGQTWDGQRVLIVNPETLCSCPPGRVGEIWIAGASVAQGYWERPDVSQATFQAYTADTCDGPFLRTGDLGFVKDGELYVNGRLKDLVIIHGQNHYPQDIERTVEHCHPAVRSGCSAVFSLSVDSEERLVVAAEVERTFLRGCNSGFPRESERNSAQPEPEWASSPETGSSTDLGEISSAIRRAVATEHDLPLHAVVLLKAATIPKTSSGKIQRHLCRAGYEAKSLTPLHCDEVT